MFNKLFVYLSFCSALNLVLPASKWMTVAKANFTVYSFIYLQHFYIVFVEMIYTSGSQISQSCSLSKYNYSKNTLLLEFLTMSKISSPKNWLRARLKIEPNLSVWDCPSDVIPVTVLSLRALLSSLRYSAKVHEDARWQRLLQQLLMQTSPFKRFSLQSQLRSTCLWTGRNARRV